MLKRGPMTGGRKRVVVPSAYNENVGDFWFFPKTASQQDNKGRGPQPVQLFLNAGDQVIPMMELSELKNACRERLPAAEFLVQTRSPGRGDCLVPLVVRHGVDVASAWRSAIWRCLGPLIS